MMRRDDNLYDVLLARLRRHNVTLIKHIKAILAEQNISIEKVFPGSSDGKAL